MARQFDCLEGCLRFGRINSLSVSLIDLVAASPRTLCSDLCALCVKSFFFNKKGGEAQASPPPDIRYLITDICLLIPLTPSSTPLETPPSRYSSSRTPPPLSSTEISPPSVALRYTPKIAAYLPNP